MHCHPTDLIRLIILLNCTCSASYLDQQDGRRQRQQQAYLPDFSLAENAKLQTFKSQITKMTQIILAYLVISLDVHHKTLFGKTVYFNCAHCLLGWLSNHSNAILSSLKLIVHEVHINGTPTEPFLCPWCFRPESVMLSFPNEPSENR